MVAFVYILGSVKAGRISSYVGWTLDLDRRLSEHNGKGKRGAKSTRGREWSLLYAEKHEGKIAAMIREVELKRSRSFRKHLLSAAFALIDNQ